ncbi:MAG: flagellar biosynthetic protein FliQ [Planctomycetes bacterium]|nr:flagellar biosynthetic protein FliQ [Planctomycetota bacterium]
MESVDSGIALAQGALIVALKLTLPVLLVGLAVGLLVSVFQALTQIQEQTLSLVPKLAAMAASLLLLAPWLLATITGYLREVLEDLGRAGLR